MVHPVINALSMAPFLWVASQTRHPHVTAWLIFVVVVSVLHHWNAGLKTPWVDPFVTFALDCFAQVMLVLAIIGLTPHLSWYAMITSGLILAAMAACAYSSPYTWKYSMCIAIGVGGLYALLIALNVRRITPYTWAAIVPLFIVFIIGNSYPRLYYLMWPLMHIIGALVMYLLLSDLNHLKR
jgi:hypothetical protein